MTTIPCCRNGREPQVLIDGHAPRQPAEDGVELCALTGGLVIIGPTSESLPGLASLIGSPGAVPVEVEAARLLTWDIARAESVLLSRRVSSIIRSGKTPIVYLDTHLEGQESLSPEDHDFVSRWLGQIIVGLADIPSYLAIYGDAAAPVVLLEGLGLFDEATIDELPCGLPLMRVKRGTFSDLHVTLTPAEGPIVRFSQLFDWFEARRFRSGICHDFTSPFSN